MNGQNCYTKQQRAKMEQAQRDYEARETILSRLPARLEYSRIVREWVTALPAAQRANKWSLEMIGAVAFEHEPRRPALRSVALVLLSLGWTTRRDYTTAGGGRRYWYAPEYRQSIKSN
jgi:hypothetical protein